MGFTQDQYNTLVAAIAQGAAKVKYADKEVEYISLEDALRLKDLMEKELGLKPPGIRTKYSEFSTGLNPRRER
ncbi:MAG TPA: hypothetical protein VGE79_00025 [Niastella sp.]